jgi:dihydrofolate reductase/thymidylate synthase
LKIQTLEFRREHQASIWIAIRVPTYFLPCTDLTQPSSLSLFCSSKVWRLPGDMAHFKRVTSTPPSPKPQDANPSTPLTNAVIMGRKTWDSIPSKFRPLDHRTNVILSRSNNPISGAEDENVIVCSSLEQAVDKLKQMDGVGDIFVIGGGQVYEESIKSGLVNKVIYTEVNNLPDDTKFDTWFPELGDEDWDCAPYPGHEINAVAEEKKEDSKTNDARDMTVVKTDKKTGAKFQFLQYTRKSAKKQKLNNSNAAAIEEGADVNPEEMQYLQMCRDIIENGVERGDRTGTGTLSKFGTQMRFSLRDGTLPLLTTKRTFWRGVAEELLWFVQVSQSPNHIGTRRNCVHQNYC